jgi:2-(1,2-epoxy-1,2-dihydrophenyl)acetyl-CoA isomerase
MNPSTTIDFALDGPIARVWLNDPNTLNAITESMVEELADCLREAEAHARVLVLSGRGGHFSSGANLSPDAIVDPSSPDFDAGLTLETHINPLVRKFHGLEIPWITSVEGAAAGVGCALALAGDLVIASESAYFLQAFRRIGLVPDGGSAFLIARSAGRVRAMEMMLLGEKIPAVTAASWGLINRVVAPDALEATTHDIAMKIASGPTRALALTRQSAWAGVEMNLAASLDVERRFQALAGKTSDFAEGVTAFREKRSARFTGT